MPSCPRPSRVIKWWNLQPPPLPSTPSFTSYFFLRCSQTWKPVDAPCAHNTRQYQFQYLFVKPAFKACANNTKKHLKGNKKKQKLPSFKASKNLGNTTWIKLETSNSKYFSIPSDMPNSKQTQVVTNKRKIPSFIQSTGSLFFPCKLSYPAFAQSHGSSKIWKVFLTQIKLPLTRWLRRNGIIRPRRCPRF